MRRAAAAAPAVAKEARRRAIAEAHTAVWVEDDFQQLWTVLRAHAGVGDAPGLLDYAGFLRVREDCVPLFGAGRTHSLLRASVFCRLPKTGSHAVDATALFEALMGSAAWQQTCLHLRFKDGAGTGRLREHELQAFLAELAPTLAGLQALPDSFATKWARLASRALRFFCQGSVLEGVAITTLLASSAFAQLLSLQGATLLANLGNQ